MLAGASGVGSSLMSGSPRWQEVCGGWCQWCGFQSRVLLTALAGGKLWLVPVVWVPVSCLAHRAGRR